MNIVSKRLTIGLVAVLCSIVSLKPAYAAQKAVKSACDMLLGGTGTYVAFREGPFAGQPDFASGRRLTFDPKQKKGSDGTILGKGRLLLSAPPLEVRACRFKDKGLPIETSTCDTYAAQYIENLTCSPVVHDTGAFAFGSKGTLAFTSTGGSAGSVTLSTSDAGNTIWAETTVQKGEPTSGVWLLRAPAPPSGRPGPR